MRSRDPHWLDLASNFSQPRSAAFWFSSLRDWQSSSPVPAPPSSLPQHPVRAELLPGGVGAWSPGNTVNVLIHITSRKMLFQRISMAILVDSCSSLSILHILPIGPINSLSPSPPLPTDLTVDVPLFSEAEGLTSWHPHCSATGQGPWFCSLLRMMNSL